MSFKTINHLLFEKKKQDLDVELLENFSPYLTTRALSMLNKELVEYVNQSLNMYGNLFETKEDTFKFFENVIPKSKRQKYEYLKRAKKEESDEYIIPDFYSKKELDNLKIKL